MSFLETAALADETLLTLKEACDHFPVKVSRMQIQRATVGGIRGVQLETIFILGKRYTSVEAIQRFIEKSQNGAGQRRHEPAVQ
jgi:hypothetical protein